jgi:hypothetical protein
MLDDLRFTLSEVEESTNHAILLCREAYTRGVIRGGEAGGNTSIMYPSRVMNPQSYKGEIPFV